MAVNHVQGLVLVQQGQQALKPPVGVILAVAVALGRGVGHHQIHSPCPPQLEPELPNAAGHLPLRVLVGAAAVESAAPQSQNSQALADHQLVLDTVAPLRRVPVVGLIVVAVHVQKGRTAHGDQKGEIGRFHVAAGDDQVYAVQPPRLVVVPVVRALLIGDKQDFHMAPPAKREPAAAQRVPVSLFSNSGWLFPEAKRSFAPKVLFGSFFFQEKGTS